MMQCANNHSLIQWHNPLLECPVCDVMKDLDRCAAELQAARGRLEAKADPDLETRKGFSHASE